MSSETIAARIDALAADPALVDAYAGSARAYRTVDLVTQREVLKWQLAELGMDGELAGDFATFLVANLDGIEHELARRRSLYGKPGAPDIGAMPDTARYINDLAEIKRRLDLEQTICDIAPVTFARHGRDSLFCQCPFPWHDDSQPSFHITPSKQLFHCHGCHFGGDVIEFLRLHLGGIKTGEAIAFARSLAGMPKPERVIPPPAIRRETIVQLR